MKLEDARDLLHIRFAAWRDQLIASDPGLIRFRFATRVTLSVGLALLVLLIFSRVVSQGLPVMLLGVVVSMLAAATVNDPEPKQQRLTTLLLPLSAAGAVTLGALLSSSRYLGDAGFVGVMFAAVYIRRFGPRGFSLGMLAFIPYFFTLFLKVTPSQLLWMFLAILLGTLCSYLMRFVILKERPEERLRSILTAFTARVGQVVDAVAMTLAGADVGTGRRNIPNRLITELNNTAFMVEGQLDAAPLRSTTGESNLLIKVFDLELAAQRLVAASTDDVPVSVRERLLPVLRKLRRVLRNHNRDDTLEPDMLQDLPNDRLSLAVRNLASAMAAMPTYEEHEKVSLPDRPREGSDAEDSQPQAAEPDEGEKRSAPARKGLQPSTRQAIQVALASALAIVGGELVSPTRWYWAAITSFVVFTGTNSRGEVLVKGWQRVLGTFVGVVAGVFVATAVHGNRGVSIPLIFVCIFFGFYLMRVSYALMIFWITILLALLYGLLGSFNPHLLLVRLEETALGAAVGVLVALWVLPTSTGSTTREASQGFLSVLGDVLESFASHLMKDPANDLVTQVRELDRSLQKLRDAAAPLTRGVGGMLGRSSTHHWLRALRVCRFEAHSLAQLSQRLPLASVESRVGEMLADMAWHVEGNVQALVLLSKGQDAPKPRAAHEPLYRIETALQGNRESATAARVLAAAHCLKRMDQIVCGLAQDYYPESLQTETSLSPKTP